MSDMKLKAPTRSGKQEKAPFFLIKYKAVAECSGLCDVVKPGVTIMSGIDFVARADKKLFKGGGIVRVGTGKLTWIGGVPGYHFRNESTGKVSDVLARMGEKFQQSNTIAKFELDLALELLKFGGNANACLDSVVKAKAQYVVVKSDDDFIRLMARKVNLET